MADISSEYISIGNTNHISSLSCSLSTLFNSSSLCDSTLLCEDGQVEAHKVILAATSSFFSSVFQLNHHNHPLIYLRGVTLHHLQPLLQFVYGGRTQVAEEDLESFLALGRDLKIKGLDEKQQEQNVMQDDKVKPILQELKGEDNEEHIEEFVEKLVVPDQKQMIEPHIETGACSEIKENEVEKFTKDDQEITSPNGTKYELKIHFSTNKKKVVKL